MLKYFSTILLLLGVIVCKAQTLLYADNSIHNSDKICVVGQVKNHVIVWDEKRKNHKAVILIYDNKLNLLRQVSTNLLISDIDPEAGFYNSDDSFYIAYQYKKGKKWEYKIARFDDNGNLSSTYVIDSSNNVNTGDSYLYNCYESDDKKVIGCVKTFFDNRYNAIRFSFTFLKQGSLSRDQLFLSYDSTHDKFIDFLIDSNKSVTLLKTSNTDSGFAISVIKKDFSDNFFFTATKRFATGELRSGSGNIFNKLKNYTVYGIWENGIKDSLSNHQKYKTGLYTWTLNDTLTEVNSDTVLYVDSAIISGFTRYANYSLRQQPDNFFGIETDSTRIPNASLRRTGSWVSQGIGGGNNPIFTYMFDPIQPQTDTHYKADFSVIALDEHNEMAWRNKLAGSVDSILLTDLSNNKIVAGKKGIHIIRSTILKNKKSTIEQIIINYAGKYKRMSTVVWDSKYKYLVYDAIKMNDEALIIPCLKGNKLIFAKMTLE